MEKTTFYKLGLHKSLFYLVIPTYLKVRMRGCHPHTAGLVLSFSETRLMVSYTELTPGESRTTAVPDGSPPGTLLQLDRFSNELKQRNKAIC